MSRAHQDLRPDDITCVIDTREQLPLADLDLKTVRGTLPCGDYSVVGLEHVVAVERKSLSDLVQCVGRERDRFERMLRLMRSYECRVIVVEAPLAAVELKQYRGEVTPEAVIGSVYSWIGRGFTVEWAGDRTRAAKAVSRILFAAARERHRQLAGMLGGLSLAPPPTPARQKGKETA
jgi:ERCC4-type nuclease